jgi:5'(3')-deoxyribonucleotidase
MPVREARKLIAVDLDQTLCDTLQNLVEWHNDTYHTQLKLTDFDTLDFWKIWGGTSEESCRKIREFYDSRHFDEIKPIKDFALEALKMLKKRGFQLVIVTSRQQFIAEKTKKFIDRHYPGKQFIPSFFFSLSLFVCVTCHFLTCVLKKAYLKAFTFAT